jgi:hypothetical protein
VSARMIGSSMTSLGSEPTELAPLPRAFFTGLVALLDTLAPPLLDRAMTKASPRADGVEVVLAHASEIAFSVWVQAERATITVGCAALHEESGDAAHALAVVAQLLCGARLVPGYDGSVLRPDFGARASAEA